MKNNNQSRGNTDFPWNHGTSGNKGILDEFLSGTTGTTVTTANFPNSKHATTITNIPTISTNEQHTFIKGSIEGSSEIYLDLLPTNKEEEQYSDVLIATNTVKCKISLNNAWLPELLEKIFTKKIVGYGLKEKIQFLSQDLEMENSPIELYDIDLVTQLIANQHKGPENDDNRYTDMHLELCSTLKDLGVLSISQLNNYDRDVVERFSNLQVMTSLVRQELGDMSPDIVNLEMNFLQELILIESAKIPINREYLQNEHDKLRLELEKGLKILLEVGIEPYKDKSIIAYCKKNGIDFDAIPSSILKKLGEDDSVLQTLCEVRKIQPRIWFLESILQGSGERIKANFNQIKSRSGRMSASNPPVQGIPREYKRDFYRPTPGSVILSADYPSIEMRCAALVANAESLIEVFKKGKCPYKLFASKLFGKPATQITPDERISAKLITLGILFGMGTDTLYQELSEKHGRGWALVNVKFAKSKLFALFPEIKEWHNRIKNDIRMNSNVGIVVNTLSGRNIFASDFTKALNYQVQGTGADILKRAVILFGSRVRELGLRAQIINLVHDDIVVECSNDQKEEVMKILKESMEDAVNDVLGQFTTNVDVEILSEE